MEMEMEMEMEIPKLRCKRCGYEWIPRIANVKKCPNRACQSVRWNEELSPEEEAKIKKRKEKRKKEKALEQKDKTSKTVKKIQRIKKYRKEQQDGS